MAIKTRKNEKPKNSVFRLYKRHRVMVRKQSRKETRDEQKKVSQSEVVRRAISQYCFLYPIRS